MGFSFRRLTSNITDNKIKSTWASVEEFYLS